MVTPSSVGAFAADVLPVSLADPHLLVLGVLVGFWVIDGVLGALEWLRGTNTDGGTRPPASPGEVDGPAEGARPRSGVE